MHRPSAGRDRAKEVRSSAKAHLQALRAERAEKRRETARKRVKAGASPPAPTVQIATDEEVPQASERLDHCPNLSLAEEASAREKNLEEEDSGVVFSMPVEGPELEERDPELAQHAPIDSDSEHSTSHEESQHEPQPDANDVEALANSELMALPGAGPGLVWVLQGAEIWSLADLAKANSEDLRSALGLVGSILDLDLWIERAASLCSEQESQGQKIRP